MNTPLLKLMHLQARGFLRRTLRGAGTPKRMVLLVLGVLMFLLWLGPTVFAAINSKRSDPMRVQTMMPVALLGICLITVITSAGDKAIAFTPGEVNFLFAAPFTRRQLIAYKLAKSAVASLLTGLFLSILLLRHARWWPACYLGIILSLLFVQLFSINAVILAQTVGDRAYSNVRRIVGGVAIVLAFLAVRRVASVHSGPGGPVELMRHMRDSPIGSAVLAPFDVFGQAMTARGPAALAKSGLLAIAIDGLLLALVFVLDSAYAQAAIEASARRYAKIQRIRGGAFLSIGLGKTSTLHLPAPPWLGGAGPVAWRQVISAMRSARGLMLLLLIVAVGAGPALAAAAASGNSNQMAPLLIGMMLWLTILIATMLKFDFRGDLDQMEVLKALPIRSAAIAIGQLLVPSFMLAALHVCVLLGAAHAIPAHRTAFLIACALALPVDLLLFAIENLIFLLFPSRPAAVSPGDFQVLGRQVVVMAVKVIALAIACLPTMFVAIFVWILSGRSAVALTLAAAPLILIEVAALVPAMAWAFDRFDPSLDTPA